MATRDGRRALYEAARTSEPPGWWIFLGKLYHYQAHEARTWHIPETPRPGKYQHASPPEVPRWMLHRPDRARLIVIQADREGYRDWHDRAQWWSRVLVTRWQIREVKPPQSLASGAGVLTDPLAGRQAPLIRMHDWTKLTGSEQVSDMATAQDRPLTSVVTPRVGAAVLDVIVVCCAPELLMSAASPQVRPCARLQCLVLGRPPTGMLPAGALAIDHRM